jgi:sugar (pentulose or hexulose) kinase
VTSRRCLAVLDKLGGFGRAVAVAGGSAADPSFRGDLADATRRTVSRPPDGDTHYSARGAALIAALAVAGGWPDGAFPAGGVAAEPDEARARRWDDLWAAHESARGRLHPSASTPGAR